jgi:hypothetical protein
MLALLAPAASGNDALNFFNNWFVTGDYVVGGVGLRGTGVNGFANGSITLSALPAGAEPIAAFLYWSTIEFSTTPQGSDGTFNGQKIRGYVVGNPQNPGCYSSGGTTGSGGAVGRVYRADVLRDLPVDANNIRQVTGAQAVSLPDSGANGNGNLIFTDGASLVVIYRVVVPGNPTVAPLKSVVIYNGAFTMAKGSAGMSQTVAGFYQAMAGSTLTFTDIVANGQAGFSSPVSINGSTQLNTSPFVGTTGSRWDNTTFNFTVPMPPGPPPIPPGANDVASFSTGATVGTNQTCLTFAAIVASAQVRDTDGDGLLDTWETNGLHRNTTVTPATFGGCSDYPSEPCVNLPAMGAINGNRDIFIQIDWMNGTGGTGGTDTNGTHVHKPWLGALSMVASAFLTHGIYVHFDVGGDAYYQSACGGSPGCYIIPSAYAVGGSNMKESDLVCQSTSAYTCDYNQPVISFEFGFASIRDGNHKATTPISAHFPLNRKDVFHYALFAHALAGPFDINGNPIDPTTLQTVTRPATPLSYSGIAQRPGGGLMVTLGLWRSGVAANDMVGSPQIQAGTLMHELGHNLGLGHAGLATQPNCMPNYQSVMNYLYQTRGLTDASGAENINYSDGSNPQVMENSLSEILSPAMKYRVRYYGPFNQNLDPANAAVKVTCDGRLTSGTGLPSMVRLESLAPGSVDWNHDGTISAGFLPLAYDVNYGYYVGTFVPQTFSDQPDWASLNLQQIGSGPNFGQLSVGVLAANGPYANDTGTGYLTDSGSLASDASVFASGAGTGYLTDSGAFANTGTGYLTDSGTGYLTDSGTGYLTDSGEMDFNTLLLSGVDGTSTLAAQSNTGKVTLTWGAVDLAQNYRVYRFLGSSMTPVAAFDVGNVLTYDDIPPASGMLFSTQYTYRITAKFVTTTSSIESAFSNAATGTALPFPLTAVITSSNKVYDQTPNASITCTLTGVQGTDNVTCSGTGTYGSKNVGSYIVTGTVTLSFGSPDLAQKYTLPNSTPTTAPNTYNITQRPLTVLATGVNKQYDGTTSATVTLSDNRISGDFITDSYTGASFSDKNVGTGKPVSVSGISISGLDSGNYSLTSTTATTAANITQAPLTITAVKNTKTYDATTSATAIPVVSGLMPGDTVTGLAETYDNANVAGSPTKTMSVSAYTVNDGNNGGNYMVKTVSSSTGAIVWQFSATPIKSSATLGSSVPVIWSLQNASSGYISDLSTLLELDAIFNGPPPAGGCVTSTSSAQPPILLYSPATGAKGKSSFRFVSPSFQFNWDSNVSAGSGCYTVKIVLNDGTTHLTTAVQLK